MNIADLPEDSDTSDEDYVPGGKPEEVVSEVDSDGDPEDPLSESEESVKAPKKRRKKTTKSRKKVKNEATSDDTDDVEKKEETEEEKKKRADSLWADFMKDTGFKSKKAEVPVEKKEEAKAEISKPKQQTVKITKVYQFAGEEVKVDKEVPVDSAEARLAQKASSSDDSKPVIKTTRKGLGGIGSVLNQLGKKPKISTLEKSKLDWERYKKEEKIEEELASYNKGKDGYLERQDFLERADLRRFEIEKEIRNIERNKRMDNVL